MIPLVPPSPPPSAHQAYMDLMCQRRDAGYPKCRGCGCTEERSCEPEGCHWIQVDLCSECEYILARNDLVLAAAPLDAWQPRYLNFFDRDGGAPA